MSRYRGFSSLLILLGLLSRLRLAVFSAALSSLVYPYGVLFIWRVCLTVFLSRFRGLAVIISMVPVSICALARQAIIHATLSARSTTTTTIGAIKMDDDFLDLVDDEDFDLVDLEDSMDENFGSRIVDDWEEGLADD